MKTIHKLKGAHSDAASCLAFSPLNTMHLVTGGHDGAVKSWDVRKLSSENESALICSVENAH